MEQRQKDARIKSKFIDLLLVYRQNSTALLRMPPHAVAPGE